MMMQKRIKMKRQFIFRSDGGLGAKMQENGNSILKSFIHITIARHTDVENVNWWNFENNYEKDKWKNCENEDEKHKEKPK